MGWKNKFHCESNQFGQKVLHHYWPQAELFTDITKSNFTKYALENRELEGMRFGQSYKRYAWDSFPTVSPICIGDDGISDRLDNITFPKWRNESIKAGGNAVVPQVVHQIFKAIEQYERIRITNKD
jgi:hypothetical protein